MTKAHPETRIGHVHLKVSDLNSPLIKWLFPALTPR